ncbi:beta strand repeat-containing protein [Alicyclobacillus fodiniaquatilis]|uniref:Beta strand repeat-containing protein n=1 Tax=Alicyclobacillus fodiniaquatilis TaxID=1661150 RepID=A0ABW4JKV3_9BACL
MKRALTGIAAAAVVLGTAAPMAFAATSSGLTKAGQLPIVVNGSVLSNPYEMTGKDSGNTTAYFPVYYFDQALTKIGYTASWDGVTHTWAITAPGVDASTVASSISGGVGTGNTTITVNGTVVKKINTKAAKDPAASKSAAATTYFPAYYIDEIFNSLGANVSFSGQTGLKITGNATNVNTPSLGDITLSGQSLGSGTSSAPAVGTNGASVTASTTLTDANGNPVAGINVTFNVWGSTDLPNVTSNGLSVSNTGGAGDTESDQAQYVATTNASGVASISLSNGGNEAYTIQAQAPYNSNGVTVTSSKAYVDFGQPGSLVLSPVSTSFGYSSASSETGVVPVTATVIPTTAGTSASNVPVTFSFSSVSGTPFISNSAGSYLQPVDGTAPDNTVTVNTDANGQATIYVNATNSAALTVQASANNLTNSSSNTLTWKQSGVADKIVNTPTSAVSDNVGTPVTISGTVEDQMGNPVANSQVLVSGYDYEGTNAAQTSPNSGDFSYVNGSTSTAFPYVGRSIAGANASSSFGDVVTTGANGQFSVEVNETDQSYTGAVLDVWAVQNGQIVGAGDSGSSPLQSYTLNFENNTGTLNQLYVDTTAAGLVSSGTANDKDTSLTGLSYQEGGSTTQAPVFVGGFAGSTPYPGSSQSGSVQYTVTSNNKGYVAAIDGVALNGTQALPNNPASAIVDVSYSSGAVSEVTVDGTPIYDAATSTSLSGYSTGHPTVGAFTFVPGDNNVENDTFTVSTGSTLSDTVGANFIAGVPAELASGVSGTIGSGQQTTLTFTVEDSNGNPIPYGTVKLLPPAGGASDLWITAVNEQTLVQNEYGTSISYGAEPTPVPLYSGTDTANIASSIYLNGAIGASGLGGTIDETPATSSAPASGTPSITLTADENGKIALTFTAGGNGVWNTGGANADTVQTAATPSASNTVYFSYDADGNIVMTTGDAPTSNYVGSLVY